MPTKVWGNDNYNNHGCAVSVTVADDGKIIDSHGCSAACCRIPDGFATGGYAWATGPNPEGGDWTWSKDKSRMPQEGK